MHAIPLYGGDTSFTVQDHSGSTYIFSDVTPMQFTITDEGHVAVVGKDSHGNPNQRQIGGKSTYTVTTNITMASGNGFGVSFCLPIIPKETVISLELIMTLPEMVDSPTGRTNIVRAMMAYDSRDSKRTRSASWRFQDKYPQYLLKGIWELSLCNGTNIVYRKSFNVQ